VLGRPSRVGQVQIQERELTVCLSPAAYVAARVLQRLVARGVDADVADAIARKVQSRYAAKRLAQREELQESVARARESERALLQSARRTRHT